MRIAFRADASLQIGIGHVMRCLTLADALRAQGAECHFISRAHPGHLMDAIGRGGFGVMPLPAELPPSPASIRTVCDAAPWHMHAGWLGSDWQTDARQTREALGGMRPDWLVVDHYALDQQWETALRPYCRKLMVIDDLADRPHHCELLLDQNLGRHREDYAALVGVQCEVLTGPQYALLRPEFAALRPYSLQRRREPTLGHLLISMGGMDLPNATGQVLQALTTCPLPQGCRISVVMGLQAPWLPQVRSHALDMPLPTNVLVDIPDMAQRMADSDLAIGAAGSTSWERCCLGLPTLVVALAENQWPGAHALMHAQAASLLGGVGDIARQLPPAVQAATQGSRLRHMSTAASALTSGQGVAKVLQALAVSHDS